jgi:transposase
MDVLYPCCAGIDVHKASVVICERDARGAQVQETIRTFGTTTNDLLAVADWLRATGCTHVAMEATGVYWKPVVRHEALIDREGVKGPLLWAVAAAC